MCLMALLCQNQTVFPVHDGGRCAMIPCGRWADSLREQALAQRSITGSALFLCPGSPADGGLAGVELLADKSFGPIEC